MSADAGALRKSKSAGDLPEPGSSSAIRAESLKKDEVEDTNIVPGSAVDSSHSLVQQPTAAMASSEPQSHQQQQPSARVPAVPIRAARRAATAPSTPLTPPPPPPPPPPSPQRRNTPPRSLYARTLAFLGVGRNASAVRRANASLAWNFAWAMAQAIVIIVMLALSSHLQSKTRPGLNEWEACSRPLGVWSCLWLVRICLSCTLYFWRWKRERARPNATDAESGNAASPPNSPSQAGTTQAGNSNSNLPPLPYTNLYKRLTLTSSLFSFSWFLTAHVLVYTSINTCRLSSPHLWWLVFGILCITYLMVLEVVILTVVVFIVAPILFLFWNIFLMCLGRHPLQNPGMIKPEIGKLSKAVVERIPLVMYIPPPPDPSAYPASPIKIPEAIYKYPPKSPTLSNVPPKNRFRWFKKRKAAPSSPKSKDPTEGGKAPEKSGEPHTWEEHWEDEGYPFVVLEGNRAACAICLMDFEEPNKAGGSKQKAEEETPEAVKVQGTSGDVTEEERQKKLLECGHVFHRTCLDPWLTDVSGRCPVCQRAVELPPSGSKTKTRSSAR
ncbi:hypothetical protein BDZ89DRAFT_1065706 [Hymenopellis radicata]|nr:hypothetical protein BDZ89DRAFT_1065706 [Hymenopellis radicata]